MVMPLRHGASLAKRRFRADALGKVRSVVSGVRSVVDVGAAFQFGEGNAAVQDTAFIK